MRMRGGADFVEAAMELAVDGQEGVLASVVVMTGVVRRELEDKGVSDRRKDDVGREGGQSLKGRCAGGAVTGEGVCTSAGADENDNACLGECKHAGSVSDAWLAFSRVISERRAALVDDERLCSWLRPRFGWDEERLKNSQSLRMAKRGAEKRVEWGKKMRNLPASR
jgi:hypothetical protein